MLNWAFTGKGVFANNNTAGNIYLRSLPGLARPDIQIIFTTLNMDSGLWFPGLTKPPVYRYTARGGLLHPVSRGWVKLRSDDPRDKPRIFFNMFGEQEDLDTMIRAIRYSRELFTHKPLADFVTASCRQARNCKPMRNWEISSAAPPATVIIRSAPARWASDLRRWSTRN